MNEDFEEFFALLRELGVEFLIIGGVAYNYYAPPRATKDIDVWIKPTQRNVRRLVEALQRFGLDVAKIDVPDLIEHQRVLIIGRAPNRIDLLPDRTVSRGDLPTRVALRRPTARYTST